MKWCIEHDPDLGVRLAALKRLTNYSEQPGLPALLLHLDKSAGKKKLEPYLSMALSRINLINPDELNERLNNG